MDHSIRTGITFGLASGTITTLGLMVGLHAGTHSRLVVIGGIFTIAISDAFSDAVGIHISEESENVHTAKEIWISTLATFCSKFIFSMTYVAAVLLFELRTAILFNIAWGVLLLTIVSYIIAREQKEKPWKVIGEHLFIFAVVIFLTNLVGEKISQIFG